ncbi:MAG TPA: outer membrane beta-barrel protein [Terracidiphilus sp.]|jgi:hypothetical protein
MAASLLKSAGRFAGSAVILIATGMTPAQSVQPQDEGSTVSRFISGSSALPANSKSDPGSAPATRAEVEALERRIEQLEIALKGEKARNLVDTDATSALKNAEKELLQGTQKSPAAAHADPAPVAPAPVEKAATPVANSSSTAHGTTPDPHAPAFSDWDWTWLNGNPRNKDVAFDSKFFTPEIRADLTYNFDFNKPVDDSIGGSSEIFRANEIQLEQLGVGGDFHLDHVRARLMTQFGMYSSTTPRNDASYSKGQWDLSGAYRYLSEAYAGYQITSVMHGINLDAGIFMSYVGLFSYYNYDNWAYQPSYVSSNTPWFFEGIRIQMFPTQHLKIEPWLINGWQSYGSANSRKGLGGQVRWTPYPWINIVSNNYGLGHDDLYVPKRSRIHTDNSVEIKYYDKPEKTLDKMAFTFTGDLGCEFGGGVSCHGDTSGGPKQSFLGYMLYNRTWFKKDLHAVTIGGGQINNPGRYLVLLPPINGETASSAAISSPYFTENPGDQFKAWDTSLTYDYMPKQWLTWRFEYDHRHSSVPYWSGHGGITPPAFLGAPYGSNNGSPTEYACMDGSPSPVISGCGGSHGPTWFPDLRRDENLIDIDLLVKF